MPIVTVDDPSDPRINVYRTLRSPRELRRDGVFIAEGRLVVRRLLTRSRYATRSLLLTPTALESLRDVVEPMLDGLTVFLAAPDSLSHIAGYTIHRGCLAVGLRGAPLEPRTLLDVGPDVRSTLVVLEHTGNPDNMGGVFRNAAGFGAIGVLLSPGCCDPLYRKAIRVSMGAALRVPFGQIADWPAGLSAVKQAGFRLVALTPRSGAPSIASYANTAGVPSRVALLLGSEGTGLSTDAEAMADQTLRIPMACGADSLNLATAAGIALHRLSHEAAEASD